MTTADNPPASDATVVSPAAANPTRRSGVALIALLLALSALLLAGWLAFELRFNPAAVQVEPELSPTGAEVTARMAGLELELQRQQRESATAQSALQAELAVLQGRLTWFESQLDLLAGIDTGQRAGLLRAEALYYLRVANAQAALAGNARVAATAMQLADDRLRESGDPAVTPVRAQLSTDLAALRGIPQADTAGLSFKLQALAGQVPDWPFHNEVPLRFAAEVSVADFPEADAWMRFKAAVANALGGIVRVRSDTEPRVAQLSAAGEALVAEAVRIELQLARLALISNNAELFRQSVAEVERLIPEYFNVDSAVVGAALSTLRELAEVELPGPVPDISASLSRLQALAPEADGPLP